VRDTYIHNPAPRPSFAARAARLAALTLTLSMLAAIATPVAGAGAAPSVFGEAAKPEAAKPAAGVKAAPTGVAKVKTTPAVKVKTTGAPAAATPTTPATATTATTETSTGTNNSMIMAVVALFVVLGGIAFYILRDARSVAPVVEGAASGGTRNPEGRLRKRRAQAKAARIQRKRHRRR
jgi:hypothetical protein